MYSSFLIINFLKLKKWTQKIKCGISGMSSNFLNWTFWRHFSFKQKKKPTYYLLDNYLAKILL